MTTALVSHVYETAEQLWQARAESLPLALLAQHGTMLRAIYLLGMADQLERVCYGIAQANTFEQVIEHLTAAHRDIEQHAPGMKGRPQ